MFDAASKRIEDVALAVQSPAAASSAAEAMAASAREALAAVIGPDLRMSRLRAGPARVEPMPSQGTATVRMSGAAFTLADKGRRTVRSAVAAPGRALSTPWGPRRSVRGSRTPGHDIMGSARSAVFTAGGEALSSEIRRAVS